MPAETLYDVYDFFKTRPIRPEEFDELYVNADRGRGEPVHGRLKRRLLRDPDGSMKILFAGHRGCGKSTELVRLQKEIGNDFVIINFSVLQELDIMNLSYIELIIVAMEKLFNYVQNETRITLKDEYLENITRWMQTKEIVEIDESHVGMDLKTHAEARFEIPFIAKFLAAFRASAKSSASMKETLKQTIEPRLSQLIDRCNELITEIKNNLDKINKKGLILVMEDLDKLPLEKGRDVFYEHSSQLTQFHCHCIFTFPIALLYNIEFNAIKNNYDEDFVLPMLKVRKKNGDENPDGIDVMTKIVDHRMKTDLFEDPGLLKKMILNSGGCLWDLFRMIRDAADNALDFEREKIGPEDEHTGYLSLKNDYLYTIAENPEKGITVDEYYKTLAECMKDENKVPDSTEILLDLRNNLSVLNYNGEGWSDVHPVVQNIIREYKKELLEDDNDGC